MSSMLASFYFALKKSIIDAEGLNFGVRHGNRCGPFAKDTSIKPLKGFYLVVMYWTYLKDPHPLDQI